MTIESGPQLLWIGDHTHREFASIDNLCRHRCDSVALRHTISDALRRPPHMAPSHVLVAQSNRFDPSVLPDYDGQAEKLNATFPTARRLLIRGSLVAPSVRLPPNATTTSRNDFLESISAREAAYYLPAWLHGDPSATRIARRPDDCDRPTQAMGCFEAEMAIVVLAADRENAASLADAVLALKGNQAQSFPVMTATDVNAAKAIHGRCLFLWDDSLAKPVKRSAWQTRLKPFNESTHVWLTNLAGPNQMAVARAAGVAHVLPKPFRLESLAGLCGMSA